MLKAGDIAVDFTLKDQNGNDISLSDFRGKKVVLYFYPKDMTPGCSLQAQKFAELCAEFEKKGAVIIGVSKDSVKSHKKFEEKYSLPFVLLSDEEHKVLEEYGVWQEKKLYGKVSMGVVRTTYIIDENGIVLNVFTKVKAGENPQQMLDNIG
ncbi:thioredoxin-dependent thiol peroxidase [Lachnospiraceae bacterium NSJ-143]|nr:thioredoxin-dependent thiol peroxidase [Lachnospiraceae bacterium NSJ-143]